jgi:hypothetical protein
MLGYSLNFLNVLISPVQLQALQKQIASFLRGFGIVWQKVIGCRFVKRHRFNLLSFLCKHGVHKVHGSIDDSGISS